MPRGKPAEYGQEIVKRRTRIVTKFLSLTDKEILDFGSGNGAQTVELWKHGCRIVACDIDKADLATLSEYITNKAIKGITPLMYDGGRIPASGEQFDAVVSFAVLEHVADESFALREIHRVLKPSGELVLSVPNKWWVFETHGARLPLLPWNRVPFFSWLPKPIHSRFAKARIYRKKEILLLLEKHGFEIRDSCYMTAPMDIARPPALQRFLRSRVFKNDETTTPFLATEIFVHCRKL
jgi:2-polyprenyl-3-methyl-5-hydroxy-6-metoxy-1,4-benzoquinol methylase